MDQMTFMSPNKAAMVSTKDVVRPVGLICGSEDVGKRALMQRLLGLEETIVENSAILNLDTKYYTAEVLLRCKDEQQAMDTTARPEAVILAFDCTRRSTYDAMVDWAGRHDLGTAAISLCVANKMDKLADGDKIVRPQWLEEAKQWCSAELIEYIEVSAKDEQVDRQLETAEDQQGVKRIRRALEAHMWPGLVMKDPSEARSAPDGGAQVRRSDPIEKSTGRSLSEVAAGPLQGSASEASNTSGTSEDQLREAVGDFDGVSNSFLAQALNLEKSTADEESETAFEKLVAEMMYMRSMLQNMNGEDRRKAAGDLMLRMQDQLGLSDGETSDDDD